MGKPGLGGITLWAMDAVTWVQSEIYLILLLLWVIWQILEYSGVLARVVAVHCGNLAQGCGEPPFWVTTDSRQVGPQGGRNDSRSTAAADDDGVSALAPQDDLANDSNDTDADSAVGSGERPSKKAGRALQQSSEGRSSSATAPAAGGDQERSDEASTDSEAVGELTKFDFRALQFDHCWPYLRYPAMGKALRDRGLYQHVRLPDLPALADHFHASCGPKSRSTVPIKTHRKNANHAAFTQRRALDKIGANTHRVLHHTLRTGRAFCLLLAVATFGRVLFAGVCFRVLALLQWGPTDSWSVHFVSEGPHGIFGAPPGQPPLPALVTGILVVEKIDRFLQVLSVYVFMPFLHLILLYLALVGSTLFKVWRLRLEC